MLLDDGVNERVRLADSQPVGVPLAAVLHHTGASDASILEDLVQQTGRQLANVVSRMWEQPHHSPAFHLNLPSWNARWRTHSICHFFEILLGYLKLPLLSQCIIKCFILQQHRR